jgi:cell division protein FtsW
MANQSKTAPRSASGSKKAAGPSSTKNSRAVAVRLRLGAYLREESSVFYTILGVTLFMVVLGLVMVLSASSVDAHLAGEGFYGRFAKQLTFALLGIPVMLIFSRFPLFFWKTWAVRFLVFAAIAQLLVFTPLGIESGGNRNWINIAGVTAQPSEALKLSLALWLGVALPRSMAKYGNNINALRPLFVAAIAMGLVLAGGDLGTAIIMFLVVLGCLIYAGVSWRHIFVPILLAGFLFLMLAVFSPNRVSRILTFFNTDCVTATNVSWCWQPLHGSWAMANGGLFGVGLGKSKAKWSWLPASDNDYIFAIIGEELGMIGCILVLALLVVLTICFLRVIRDAKEPMIQTSTGGIMMWITGQAFVNIAVVLGLVPVLGVPLPFISSGGTSLFTALAGVGVVLSFAHHNQVTASRR